MAQLGDYLLFCEQLKEAIEQYPNLKIHKNVENLLLLKGILDIPNDTGEIVGSFLIEIKYSPGFPYRFPTLFEIGGLIPGHADWHKYNDGSCCITVPADEILKCNNGVSVSGFIANYAIPYFANYLYRKQEGKYKNGEFDHGKKGIFQFYETLMKTDNTKLWLEYYKVAFEGKPVSHARNKLCFCGSKLKYKVCHSKLFYDLQCIGQKQVSNDFKMIFT